MSASPLAVCADIYAASPCRHAPYAEMRRRHIAEAYAAEAGRCDAASMPIRAARHAAAATPTSRRLFRHAEQSAGRAAQRRHAAIFRHDEAAASPAEAAMPWPLPSRIISVAAEAEDIFRSYPQMR